MLSLRQHMTMIPDNSACSLFRERLFKWAAQHHRPMPWKGEKDAYKIWLSEIILQQTRVEQGLPYYQKFVARYPTVRHLAEAPENDVLKCWEGLGYYSRARNLHAAAKFVSKEWHNIFPNTYENIRALKGVGDYTAAAIASFAFDLPFAVLDGNVYRVLSRIFGIETPIDMPAAKKEFAQLAQALLDPEKPGAYNQAIMDFGATHCTPQKPSCRSCPFAGECVADQTKRVATLPVKVKKMVKKERFFLYLVLMHKGDTFLNKRTGRDIWMDLYEFPLLELANALPSDVKAASAIALPHLFKTDMDLPAGSIQLSSTYRQILTHQVVQAVFVKILLPDNFPSIFFKKAPFEDYLRVPFDIIQKKFAFPRIIDIYLQDKVLTLGL